MSSEGRSTTDTVDSTTCSAADLWMAWVMISRARAWLFSGLFLDPADHLDGLEPGLILDRLDELSLGLFLGQAGDPLQLLHLLLDQPGDLLLLDVEVLLPLEDAAFPARELPFSSLHGLGPPVEVLFLVDQTPFHLIDFLPPVPGLALELLFEVPRLLLDFGRGLLGDQARFRLGLLQDGLGFFPRPEQPLGDLPLPEKVIDDGDDPQDEGRNADDKFQSHVPPPSKEGQKRGAGKSLGDYMEKTRVRDGCRGRP
jgi:hypothetical protein